MGDKRLQTFFFLFLHIFLFSPLNAPAKTQQFLPSGFFDLSFSNDVFAGTDRSYTGGIKITWMSYRKRHPFKWLPFSGKSGFEYGLSFSLGQHVYTPDDIGRNVLIVDDRPYAGILYFSVAIHSKNNQRQDCWDFTFGIVGPHSYAEQLQRLIHRLINESDPKGWSYQLKDELVLAVAYERKWKVSLVKSGVGAELIPHLGAGLGSIYTFAQLGAQIRTGWRLPDDFGIGVSRPGGSRSVGFRDTGEFGVHFFVALDGKALLRNIFLDGNTFRKSHNVEKNFFTFESLLGINFRFWRVQISYAHVFWTRQFKTESRGQRFGTLNLTYSY